MAEHKYIDEATGTETTGHEWDGLQELNTPLPRWWVNTFYITIVWAIGYCIAMPAWPLISDYTKGVLGASQREQVITAHKAAVAERAQKGGGLVDAELEVIKNDQNLLNFAMANGKAAFGDNCAPCHGSGATGAVGYPNLNDDDWLWGGTLDDIHTTLKFGIRSGHDDARVGDMQAFGTDEILSKEEIQSVSNYVLSLSGGESGAGADLEAGKILFADNCAACHGEDGKGLTELGAPNLADKIWLFGGDLASIVETVTNGRKGVMPAWTGRLDDVTVKSLAVFVHSLGGGK